MENARYDFENPAIEMDGESLDAILRRMRKKPDELNNPDITETQEPDTLTNDSMMGSIKKIEDADPTEQYHTCLLVALISKGFKHIRERAGLIIGLLSAIFYSGNSFFLKLLSQRIHPFQVVSMAMPILILCSSLAVIIKRPPRPTGFQQYVWLLFGGLSVSMYLTFITLSLANIDVADAVTISYASLMFVGVVSRIILREPLRLFDFIFSIIALTGVVFIARPNYLFHVGGATLYKSNQLVIGVCLALGAALGIALILTVFRKLSQLGIFKGLTILSGGICTLTINSMICTILEMWSLPTVYDCLVSTAAGFCYFSAHVCIVIALKLETATIINVMTTFEIVFSFVWQFLFLDVSPFWSSYVGGALLTCAALGMTLYKRQTPRTPDQAGISVNQPMDNNQISNDGCSA